MSPEKTAWGPLVFLVWALLLLAGRSPWPLFLRDDLWLFLGVFFSGAILLRSDAVHARSPFRVPGALSPETSWVWLLPILGGVMARLGLVFIPGHWPVLDEGLGGFFAMRLTERWDGGLLEGASNQPRLFTWGQAVWFEVFGASLETQRSYTAFLSCAGFLGLVSALRRWLVPSAALIGVFIAAFGFWPLWIGRFAVAGVLLVLWVSWLLWLFGVYRDLDVDSPRRLWVAASLGLWTGIGFYTYLSWPLIAIWSLGMVVWTAPSGRRNHREILGFFFFLCLLAIPLVWEVLQVGLPQPFHRLWKGPGSGVGLSFSGIYLKALWIGVPSQEFNFGTLWGGLMNPILGSAVLFGILATLKRDMRNRSVMILLVAAPFLILSGELTKNLEVMRIAHLMPWTVFFGAVGIWEINAAFPRRWGVLVIAVMLVSSSGLDLRDAFKGAGWGDGSLELGPSMHLSRERQEAYRILKARSRKEGPGILLLDLVVDPTNQTLTLATLPFNTLRGGGRGLHEAVWAAAFMDIHGAVAVARRFRESEFHALSREGDYPDGGLGLVVFPVKADERAVLARWALAENSLRGLVRDALERGVASDQTQDLAELDRVSEYFRHDPELEACWARIRMVHECAAGDYEAGLRALEGVVGPPRADLENDKGLILYTLGRKKEAERAFKRALGCPVDFTDARNNLLKSWGKVGAPS